MVVLVALVVAATGQAGAAFASQLIDRNASGVSLQLNDKGEALLTYLAGGVVRHVLAWGAVNASPPTAGARQVEFRLDYTGGYEKYFKDSSPAQLLAAKYAKIKGQPGYLTSPVVRDLQHLQQTADDYWQTAFQGGCGSYDGPEIAWAVVVCQAPDGSYWAVQQWQRELPDYGVAPTAPESAWELRLSHWTGQLPLLAVHVDWAWHRWDHLFGTFTYLGAPVFGFHSSSGGNPLDSYGRNVYIDTDGSPYGSGWRRENSALTHKRTGAFCYSVNPHAGRPAGAGSEYRITVIGPGVTPDVMWQGAAPGPYNGKADQLANQQIAALGDTLCLPN